MKPSRRKSSSARRSSDAKRSFDALEVELAKPHPGRLRVVEPRVGEQGPERGERARVARHEHRSDLQRPRELAGVQRAGPAVRDERRAARVVAPVGRDEPERLGHVVVRDVDDPLGDALAREAEPLGQRLERAGSRIGVEREIPGEQEIRREAAEVDVGVGHRRLGAPAAVARGARGRRPRSAGRP